MKARNFPPSIYAAMAKVGMFGITVPDELGGAGADAVSYAYVMEELSRGYASIADQCGLVELVGTLLATHGTPEQQQQYLRPLLAAKRRCAYAITEAEAGSDVSGIKTTATETPDGWTLSGGKLWIHNAPVADFAVVLARTAPEQGKRGMSIFLVDKDQPGYRIGRHEHKMGQRASQVGALHFDEIKLPKTALLGPLNRGFHMMMSVLDKGRVGIAALAVGILQGALEASVAQAKERKQFGQAIAEFQAVQWMLADMAKDVHAARLMTHDAAAKLDRGERATTECSMAKCFAADAAVTAHRQRRADPRRHGLHSRHGSRAALSRRQDHADLRGHQPDPAHADRARAAGLAFQYQPVWRAGGNPIWPPLDSRTTSFGSSTI